jgi:hypothetical protein
MNGLGKIASRTGTTRLLQRHPQVNFLHPLPSLHPPAWTSLDHITHLHGLDEVSSENFPLPVDTSPIGCLVFFSKLVLQACVMSLSF